MLHGLAGAEAGAGDGRVGGGVGVWAGFEGVKAAGDGGPGEGRRQGGGDGGQEGVGFAGIGAEDELFHGGDAIGVGVEVGIEVG